MESRKKVGFFLGPFLFVLAYFSPLLSENPKAHCLLAVFLLIVVWWVTECIPIPVTALLIPVFMVFFQIAPAKDAFAPFADPIIMLFLGSFILARAMTVHALDRKLALSVLSLRWIKQKRERALFALGLTSLFLSMWISNTATTAMMFPIALGVLDAFRSIGNERKGASFSIILLLTLAYAASIGGIGTPIGSPPNIIAIRMLERMAGYRITFFQWMIIGFLVLIPMYFALFFFMRSKIKKGDYGKDHLDLSDLRDKESKKGLSRAQKNVLIAFSITVFLWVFPGVIALIRGQESPLYLWFRNHIPESAAAVIGASLLFFLPVRWRGGEFTLSFKEAVRIDWGTLLLFGGGLSLGFQMFETGLADAIGKFFISLGGDSAGQALITLLAVAFTVFMTELTSNTASANMIVPIIIAVSQAAGINPLLPVIGSAIGCSFAFMLPVATPPNAIVFGSGMVRLTEMMKYGFWLNIFGISIIWLVVNFLVPILGLI
ncbi:MAG: SLC13/DASS family transporter [Candidatus Aminicenantes bacterium]|nr:SLC13/DASS family transporter [Candidatus Aminicenantes bacterium]